MFHNNPRGQSSSFVKEKQVLEPEASCEDHVMKRAQSRRKIKKTDLSVRKSCRLNGSLKTIKSRKRRRQRSRILKVPKIPEELVNLVKILQHKNFLQVVDEFFKQSTNKQPRKKTQPPKKSQTKKSGPVEKFDCKPVASSPINFDSNTL